MGKKKDVSDNFDRSPLKVANYGMRFVPELRDFGRKQFENQFSRPPADPLLSSRGRALFLTGIEARGPWSLTVETADGRHDERQGMGDREFLWAVYCASLVAHSGIDRVYGFAIERPER